MNKDDGAAHRLVMLEDDMAALEPGFDEDAKDVVEIVGVAGDERLIERLAAQEVGNAIEDGSSLARATRPCHERRCGSSVEEMEPANPPVADAAEQLAEE